MAVLIRQKSIPVGFLVSLLPAGFDFFNSGACENAVPLMDTLATNNKRKTLAFLVSEAIVVTCIELPCEELISPNVAQQ